MVVDTTDNMYDYGKIGSLDKSFFVVKMKGLVGLDVIPMNSKGINILLQVAKVGATMC